MSLLMFFYSLVLIHLSYGFRSICFSLNWISFHNNLLVCNVIAWNNYRTWEHNIYLSPCYFTYTAICASIRVFTLFSTFTEVYSSISQWHQGIPFMWKFYNSFSILDNTKILLGSRPTCHARTGKAISSLWYYYFFENVQKLLAFSFIQQKEKSNSHMQLPR